MKQTLFEQNGGTYTRQGDYMLPDVKLPDQPKFELGVWANRRRQFLRSSITICSPSVLSIPTWLRLSSGPRSCLTSW